jgi:hypothetical protein
MGLGYFKGFKERTHPTCILYLSSMLFLFSQAILYHVLLLSSILTLAVCCKAVKFSHLHISLIPSPCFIPSTYNILQIRCWRNGDKLMYGIKQKQTNLVCTFQKFETFKRHITNFLFVQKK